MYIYLMFSMPCVVCRPSRGARMWPPTPDSLPSSFSKTPSSASKAQIATQNGHLQATSGFEMCFLHNERIAPPHLWCRGVPTVPTKTRLESRFCNKEV